MLEKIGESLPPLAPSGPRLKLRRTIKIPFKSHPVEPLHSMEFALRNSIRNIPFKHCQKNKKKRTAFPLFVLSKRSGFLIFTFHMGMTTNCNLMRSKPPKIHMFWACSKSPTQKKQNPIWEPLREILFRESVSDFCQSPKLFFWIPSIHSLNTVSHIQWNLYTPWNLHYETVSNYIPFKHCQTTKRKTHRISPFCAFEKGVDF